MSINFNKAEFIRSAADRSGFLRDGLPQFAFAGRSNVGKSSVINRLVSRKNLALTSLKILCRKGRGPSCLRPDSCGGRYPCWRWLAWPCFWWDG